MKFITEEDLRSQYKVQPFTTYEPEHGTRLTPGARQFLADRGMLRFDDGVTFQLGATAAKQHAVSKKDCMSKEKREKLLCRIRSIEANIGEMQACLCEMKAELAAIDGDGDE